MFFPYIQIKQAMILISYSSFLLSQIKKGKRCEKENRKKRSMTLFSQLLCYIFYKKKDIYVHI
jgi:hypothetical protein